MSERPERIDLPPNDFAALIEADRRRPKWEIWDDRRRPLCCGKFCCASQHSDCPHCFGSAPRWACMTLADRARIRSQKALDELDELTLPDPFGPYLFALLVALAAFCFYLFERGSL